MVTEEQIINKLATYFEQIAGMKTVYSFAEIPGNLAAGNLPATIFYPPEFTVEHKAHPGVFQNVIKIRAITFVMPREAKGGQLKFLENDAMPFLQKTRLKFENRDVVFDLLSLGFTKAFLTRGTYAAGGLLTFNNISYIGCVFDFDFYEITNC